VLIYAGGAGRRSLPSVRPAPSAGALVKWIRRHALALGVAAIGILSFAAFTWSERAYFCDQAKDHMSPCQGFWSSEHLHDWIYNAASNYQSELLFGVLLVVLLHKAEGPHGADRDDT
jgi:hypothetical protein